MPNCSRSDQSRQPVAARTSYGIGYGDGGAGEEMNMPCALSVVIPTYQRCASVERALKSLVQQTIPPRAYEVIASIDGSQDGTCEMVAGFPAPYVLRGIWQPNRGRAAACNAGIRAAKGEVIVLLDDDMEAAPALLATHLGAHAAGGRLGVMGAVPIHLDRSSPPVVAYVGAKFDQHLQKLAQPEYRLRLRDFYSGIFSTAACHSFLPLKETSMLKAVSCETILERNSLRVPSSGTTCTTKVCPCLLSKTGD